MNRIEQHSTIEWTPIYPDVRTNIQQVTTAQWDNNKNETQDLHTKTIPFPSLEWREFVHICKNDERYLSTITNSHEIRLQYRKHLELEIKDTLLWAIKKTALMESTETVREKTEFHTVT